MRKSKINIPETNFDSEVCKPFFFEGGEHGVLLIHGFTGSCSHMRLIGDELSRMGFTVQGINLPGHGISLDAMDKTGKKDWISAAENAYLSLREKCKYITVAGLSMGGDITLLLAEKYNLTCAVPISAPMKVQNRLMPFSKVLAPLVPMISWSTGEKRDEKRKEIFSQYDYGYYGFPTHCAGDLWDIMKCARKNLSKIKCPVMVVQSHGDETISADSGDIIISGVSSSVKKLLWLDDVPHVCTATAEYKHIAEEMAEFMHKAE